MAQDPILSVRDDSVRLDLGGHQALHRISSSDTASAFSVLEMLVEPGEGADVHTHANEDELVHVLEGEVEVSLGDQTMAATAGVVALLPRGIPHGYRNTSDAPCRIMDVILPGRGDEFFVGVNALVRDGKASKQALAALMNQYSIS